MLATSSATPSRGASVIVTPGCSFCGKDYRRDPKKASKCNRCRIRFYCSSKCRDDDWKLCHKKECRRWRTNSGSGGVGAQPGTPRPVAPVTVGDACATKSSNSTASTNKSACPHCEVEVDLESPCLACHNCGELFCDECANNIGENISDCNACNASFYCSEEELFRRLSRLLRSRSGCQWNHVPIAQYQLGLMHLRGEGTNIDPETAAWWFLLSAKGGVARAQVELGIAYATGTGVDQDDASAVRWFRQAAEQGCPAAAYHLGAAYEEGKGTPQDANEALKWYTIGAENGDANAQACLGRIHECGSEAMEQNKFLALQWYNAASEQGDAMAQINLGNFYRKGIAVAQSNARAEKCYMSAAEKGHPGAQRNLGNMYFERGQLSTACEWYHRAAEQGDAGAALDLGAAYERGDGVEQDDESAAKWYHIAALKGLAEGQYHYGRMLENGFGVGQDDKEAAKWFSAAAVQGHKKSYIHLGNFYRSGDGVVQDYAEALRLYEAAGELGIPHVALMKENGEHLQATEMEEIIRVESPNLSCRNQDRFDSTPDEQLDTIVAQNMGKMEAPVTVRKTLDFEQSNNCGHNPTLQSPSTPGGDERNKMPQISEDESNACPCVTAELPEPLVWHVWNQDYAAPIQDLKDSVFGCSKSFWLKSFMEKSYTNVIITDWVNNAREVEYVIPRNGLQGKVAVKSTERITLNSPNAIVVEIETKTPGVPYGQSFCTCTQYVFLADETDANKGIVKTTAGIKWLKSCTFKDTVTKKVKAAMVKGITETMNYLSNEVWSNIEAPIKSDVTNQEIVGGQTLKFSLISPPLKDQQKELERQQREAEKFAAEQELEQAKLLELQRQAHEEALIEEHRLRAQNEQAKQVQKIVQVEVSDLPSAYEWNVWSREYTAPISKLKDSVFGSSPMFWLSYFKDKAYTDVSIGDWVDKCRQVKYTIPRQGLQGKVAVISTECITMESDGVIVVDIQTQTPGVTYGLSFHTCTQYVFTAHRSDLRRGSLSATAGIKWLKSCAFKDTVTKKVKVAMLKGVTETLERMTSMWSSPLFMPI